MKPQFTHDCDSCIYLGTESLDYHGDEIFEIYDLYFCAADIGGPTVIARYGDSGPEYKSGMVFAKPGHPLNRAKELAIERKLYKE